MNHREARRFVIKGTPGSGKSTLGTQLAGKLGLAYIELDALHHGPDWSQPTKEEFCHRVGTAMAVAPNGWVIDGNYDGKLGATVVTVADRIVWLDLPLRIKLWRIGKRSWHRVRNNVELWNGNRETWRSQFASRDSIFIELIAKHRKQRCHWPARFAHDPRVVRLRSAREVRRWLDEQPSSR